MNISPKRRYGWRIITKHLTSSFSGEMKTKVVEKYHSTPRRMEKIIKKGKKHQVLMGMWSSWDSLMLLVEMQNGSALWKTVWQFPIK